MKKHISISLLTLILTLFISCEKEPTYVDFFAEDSPKSLIVQLQDKYTIEEVTDNGPSYTVIFHNPSHFVSKTNQVYPDGIRTLTVDKTDVSKFTENESFVQFVFRPYKTATLYYYNKQNPVCPLKFSVIYDSNRIYRFEDYYGTVEIPFKVKENTNNMEIKVFQPRDNIVKTTLEMSPDNSYGKVILSVNPDYDYDLDQSVEFRIGTDEFYDFIKVPVFRKEFLIFDNKQKEITLELDDIARTWWVNLSYNGKPEYKVPGDKNFFIPPTDEYKANITEGEDWITIEKISYIPASGYPRLDNDKAATLYLKFKHFIGSGTRQGTILITRKNCEGQLKVNVIQSGSENPGSIRGALMALYNQCGGKEWKLQENWGSDLDVEEWCGISFRTLSVSEEEMSRNPHHNKYCSVSGKAYGPPELTAMEFDFWHEGYWNVIKGKIPDEFWNIKCGFKLFTVCFVENADINKVPPSMWTPKLRTIELDCMANGQPAYLCTYLSNITKAIDAETIILHGKNFSGQLPDDIGKMKRLKKLEINALDLKTLTPIEIGPCPASIVECESLEYLYLAAITNTIPDEIIYLPNIKCCEYINKELGYFCLIDR